MSTKSKFLEEVTFFPISDICNSEPIQLGISRSGKKPSLVIRLNSVVSINQINKFVVKHKGLIDEIPRYLHLPEGKLKRGKKQVVPANLAYTLHSKFNWKPKKIDQFIRIFFPDIETKDVDGELNPISISQAIIRRKRTSKR